MNLNPMLDVAAPRSSAPLDRPVSDSPDPAFANVMSRVRENGDEMPSDDPAAPEQPATSAAAQGGSGSAGEQTAAAADDAQAPGDSGAVAASGQPLPGADASSGQTLPPAAPLLPGLDTAMRRPAGEKDTAVGDAIDAGVDPSLGAVPLPGGAAAAVPLPGAVAVATAPIDSQAAASVQPADPRLQQLARDAAQGTVDGDAASDSATGKTIDAAQTGAQTARPAGAPTTATAGSALPVAAQAGQADRAQPGTDDAVAGAPLAQTLRAFVRTANGGDAAEPALVAGTGRGAARSRALDGVAAGAGVRAAAAQVAAMADAAAQADSSAVQQDLPDDASLRTEAVGQRGNATPDTARDVAPARLNDLAQVHAQRFAAELADRVLVLRSQRFDTASVTLEPRELGRIDIQVRLQADTTHVAFTTQHAAVRDALEAQLPRLRALLEDAGLSLGGVDVSQSGGRDGADSGTQRAYEPQRAASMAVGETLDSGTARQRRVANALIDLHA